MTETVSIIIPVYCAAGTLRRCVESLIQGRYPHLEILLVEDHSTDDSWALCRELQQQYACVRAFRTDANGGPSVARNRGLEQMTGQLLMFVDSDDWVEPDFVSSFVECWKQQQPDLIACGYWNHDEIQECSTDYFGWPNQDSICTVPLKESLLNMYEGRLLQQIWNKFFRADIIKENRLRFDTDIRMGEDFRFLLSYLACVPENRLVCINRPLYHYIRCSGQSLMSQFGREKIDEPLKNLEKLYEIMGLSEAEREARLRADRQQQIESYAYLIMHNAGMAHREKRRLILGLDEVRGRILYRNNMVMLWKERILKQMKKLGLR